MNSSEELMCCPFCGQSVPKERDELAEEKAVTRTIIACVLVRRAFGRGDLVSAKSLVRDAQRSLGIAEWRIDHELAERNALLDNRSDV